VWNKGQSQVVTLINYFITRCGGPFSTSSGFDRDNVRGRGNRGNPSEGHGGYSSDFESSYV
jgi:hypothetical protein